MHPPSEQPEQAKTDVASHVGTKNTLAIVTLVFGILGMIGCLPLGIAAIVTGIIALARVGREPQRYGGKGMAIAGLVCGGLGFVFYMMLFAGALLPSIMLPSLSRARELSKRLVCASNMKGISTSMRIYTNDYPGAGDVSMDMLIDSGMLTPNGTLCPSSMLSSSNFVIVSYPVGSTIPTNAPLMYEPKSNHGGEGGNVMFTDGHVEFLRSDAYDQLIQQVLTDHPEQ